MTSNIAIYICIESLKHHVQPLNALIALAEDITALTIAFSQYINSSKNDD